MSLPHSILFPLALAATAAVAHAAQAALEPGGFTPGQPLPALELPTIDGARTVRLSELRGKKLLLIQFASW